VEPDEPDPLATIDRLLRQLPAEVRQPLADWLGGLTTSDIRAFAGVATAQGTALPVAIRVEPAVLRLSGGEVTVTTRPPPGVRTQQDLTLSASIVVVVCLTWITVATQPFPQALIPPLTEASMAVNRLRPPPP
jgi:hypothetical protein